LVLSAYAERHICDRYAGWLNDPAVIGLSRQRLKAHTVESCRAYVASYADGPNVLWAIERHDGEPTYIGNIRANVDEANGTADVAILIGERDCWGKGYGLEAWNAVCRWLLTDGGVRKVYAGTTEINKGMLAIMKKAGMAEDGVRRRHYVIDGQEVDVVYGALFRDDVADGDA